MSKKPSINFDELKLIWGESISSLQDIAEVFISYLKGKIKKFPFSEGCLSSETSLIMEPLIKLNKNKILTINSQPKANGVPSTDPKVGWGNKKGFVY